MSEQEPKRPSRSKEEVAALSASLQHAKFVQDSSLKAMELQRASVLAARTLEDQRLAARQQQVTAALAETQKQLDALSAEA